MKKGKRLVGALAVMFVSLAVVKGSHGPPVGYESLAGVDSLWQWTGEVKTGMIASSDPDRGNRDFSNFHGYYRGEPVLAELDGPGCIYRIWSAKPTGRIRVYLDGSEEPEIDCSFKDYLEGGCKGLPEDFVVGRTANYMPIPFDESIIITAPRFRLPAYYQVSYQLYRPWIQVQSFQKNGALRAPHIEEAKRTWYGETLLGSINARSCRYNLEEVLPGEKTALQINGTGVIRNLLIRNRDDHDDPLSGFFLRMYWDGSEDPAVEAPLDAFFINRFDINHEWPGEALMSMYIESGSFGYLSLFPMPFIDGARVELENRGQEAKDVLMVARWDKEDRLPISSMRFHAAFHEKDCHSSVTRDNTVSFNTSIDPSTNYVVLDRKGTGHYMGCALFVKSKGALWWGEGDEWTYVDGELRIHGTGTEDEFNWSWGYETHMSPVSGTLPSGPDCEQGPLGRLFPWLRNDKCDDMFGHNVAYRFRPTDYVPFRESVKVSYEILGHSWKSPHLLSGNLSQHRGDDYSSVAYWYETHY